LTQARFLAATSDLQGPVAKVPVRRGISSMMSGSSPPSACAASDETTMGGAVCAAVCVAAAVSESAIENTRPNRAATMFVLRQFAVIHSQVIEHLGGRAQRNLQPPQVEASSGSFTS
jgi:hypothetical protein